jgi:hypothetical protein
MMPSVGRLAQNWGAQTHKNSIKVGQGSPDQAHEPWCDDSVPENSGRSVRKSSRQLFGTDVQVGGYEARALLDPGCESELFLSKRCATQ